jgi:hypothetical protein
MFVHMPLQSSVPDTFTLAGDYESRVTQLLDLARQQVRLAKGVAAPRMHDALTELDYVLEDQLAALANAIETTRPTRKRRPPEPPQSPAVPAPRGSR